MSGSAAYQRHQISPDQALDILADIDQRGHSAMNRLPETAPVTDVWDGLVFHCAGVRLTSAMSEISEMLPLQPRVTRVPGALPWMLGLANVRSSLLPLVDLQVYLGSKPVVSSKSCRILVLRLQGLAVGLLVPVVFGMRHFHLRHRVDNARMKGLMGAYVYEAFSIDGEVWPVFSMQALAADPAFRSAAA